LYAYEFVAFLVEACVRFRPKPTKTTDTTAPKHARLLAELPVAPRVFAAVLACTSLSVWRRIAERENIAGTRALKMYAMGRSAFTQ
jgi:hypothetical protein